MSIIRTRALKRCNTSLPRRRRDGAAEKKNRNEDDCLESTECVPMGNRGQQWKPTRRGVHEKDHRVFGYILRGRVRAGEGESGSAAWRRAPGGRRRTYSRSRSPPGAGSATGRGTESPVGGQARLGSQAPGDAAEKRSTVGGVLERGEGAPKTVQSLPHDPASNGIRIDDERALAGKLRQGWARGSFDPVQRDIGRRRPLRLPSPPRRARNDRIR